jgi:RNA polymerase sigma-70 factor (ECF subfamily)
LIQEEPTMSVITAVLPRAILRDSQPVDSPSPWEEEFAAVIPVRLTRLQRLARRIVHSEDLAEDAVQEALISLWQEGRMPANPEGWLVRAVVHRSLHLNRTRRRRQGYEARASALRPERDPCGDVSRALEAREAAHAIAVLLGKLPEPLRAVFVMRESEACDYASIAAALGVPTGTVRSRLHRAREALKVELCHLACA